MKQTLSAPTTDFAPSMLLKHAQKRAEMLAKIRDFFAKKNILEVTTPILSQAGNSDVFIESVAAHFHQQGKKKMGYLHTSPEFAMKRLLASWQVPIYQICPVFRDNEKGSRHNIEFTMLEWYRPDFSLSQLADELSELLSCVLSHPITLLQMSYTQAFTQKINLHPFRAELCQLKHCAEQHGINLDMKEDRQGWLDLLFSHLIEPTLGKDQPTLIMNYPPATAALAKTDVDEDGFLVAKRFELYIDGLEIANAYDESSDANELYHRFIGDNQQRDKLNLPQMPLDTRLLSACHHLPDCSGIALGVDRLFMVKEKLKNINQAIAIMTDDA